MTEVTVSIDGEAVSLQTGATVLDAIHQLGKDVPTLCYSKLMEPYGACRTCMVEQKSGKPVASCHTPVRDGAEYITRSPALTRLRRNITELIVSDHPLECLDCSANGRCDLQALAAETGLRHSRYQQAETHQPPPDDRHPFIKVDMDKCIVCARCVRACDEVQGSFILGMSGRGFDAKVIAGNDTGFEEADCVSCGQCVFECPVGALEEAQTRETGLANKTVTTTCCYCGVGCSLKVNVKDGEILNIEPDPEGSANRGHACVKGRFAHQFGRSEYRLTSPLIRDEQGEFREASWDEALDLVASRLSEVREKYGSDAFACISSARGTNEESFMMSKFTRLAMGTNNIDNCSRVCHSPSAFGLNQALGTGAGTNSFQDVEHSEVIMIVGANPTEAHPVFGARIKQAVLNGCRLIVLDPRNTELAGLADLHLALRPGSNVAVINALQQVLITESLVDGAFITRCSEGFETLAEEVIRYTPEWASEISGVDPALIRQAARMYAGSRASQILWGLGVTEAGHGSNAVFGLINMAVMTGNLGRPGTGTNPIRGQNNVQGVSDVGALPDVFSDYRKLDDPTARADHVRVWGAAPPLEKGLRIPQMFAAAHGDKLKAMFVFAEDIAQSDPDTAHVIGALESLDFLVVLDIFMCETAKYADVVLPGSTAFEKEGTFTNSDRRIQRVRRAVLPPDGLMTDGDVINAISRRMGYDLGFDDGPDTSYSPARVMKEIASLTPSWAGVSYERLEESGFLQWPCPHADHPGTDIVHRDGRFLRGKAKLTSVPWQNPGELPDEEFPLMLTTGRMLFHYNVGAQTRRTPIAQLDRAKEETVRIHPRDASQYDVVDGMFIEVISRRGRVRVKAQVSRLTSPGTLFMTFHYPETPTNILVGPARDEFTDCPEYKVVAVRLQHVA